MHQSLIAVAWYLVDLDADRPRETTLRRAISTAYYSVFHSVCRLCADELVGRSIGSREWNTIYRSVDHSAFRTVREQDLRTKYLSPLTHEILNLVVDLQRDRHNADYNPEPLGYGRLEVRSLINSADVAIIALDALSALEKRSLAVALIARPRRL